MGAPLAFGSAFRGLSGLGLAFKLAFGLALGLAFGPLSTLFFTLGAHSRPSSYRPRARRRRRCCPCPRQTAWPSWPPAPCRPSPTEQLRSKVKDSKSARHFFQLVLPQQRAED